MCRGNRATVHTVNASILSRLIIIQTACVLPNSPLYVTYPSLSTEQSIVFPWTESSQSMKSSWNRIFFTSYLFHFSELQVKLIIVETCFNQPGWGCLHLKTDVLNFIPLNILHAAKKYHKNSPVQPSNTSWTFTPRSFQQIHLYLREIPTRVCTFTLSLKSFF